MEKKQEYGNDSIQSLKAADRVRLRPAVIFGSDGIDGCQHSIFEILSNSIDEAREGRGNDITVTRFIDHSVQVEDHGSGIPVEYNEKEERYNWELVFCEMYAGGKYNNDSSANYEYSLGLNGLGLCAPQYASEYMDVDIRRDGFRYTLHFEHGENVGGLQKEPYARKDTGTVIKWRPDLQVFTDIAVDTEYYLDILKRQAVVNAGVTFHFRNETAPGMFETTDFCYENGILDHALELAGENALTPVQFWQSEKKVKDREDMNLYNTRINVAAAFSNHSHVTEYYHNSSWLEHGGAPDKAVRSAFVYQIDAWLKQNNKYTKNESKITFQDVEDCLIIVISSFSTQTSYENQTKKAITNKGIQEAMTEMLRHNLEVYFIENPLDAEKISNQVLVNKRSREGSKSLTETKEEGDFAQNKAEQIVLGGILLDPVLMSLVSEIIPTPEPFKARPNMTIYGCMLSLFHSGRQADIIAVLEELSSTDGFDEKYYKDYLMNLAQSVPSISDVYLCARQVQTKS